MQSTRHTKHRRRPKEAEARAAFISNHKPRLPADNGSSYIAGDLADWLEDRDMMAIACHSPEKSKLKIPKSVACEFNRADTGRHKRPKTGKTVRAPATGEGVGSLERPPHRHCSKHDHLSRIKVTK